MKSSIILAAAVFANAIAGQVTSVGCYKSSVGVTKNGTDDYMSQGKCLEFCPDSPALATQYKTCYCGDGIPSDADKVDDDKCTTKCPGYPQNNCGGNGLFFFYNTGIDTNLQKAGSSDSSSSDSSNPSQTATAKASVVTVAGKTVTATAASDASASAEANKSSGGPSKAGIAAGVVVGVVAIAGIAGGVFMFMRNRKRRAIEEEHRRNAAVNNFVAGGKPPMSSAGSSSFTDTRLDPVMANRRMSDGSIADNQDYSRRILKVTNA